MGESLKQLDRVSTDNASFCAVKILNGVDTEPVERKQFVREWCGTICLFQDVA